MTLTKYQRGDEIEGWNDMPLLMVAQNAPGSAPRPRRKVTRVAHNLDAHHHASAHAVPGGSTPGASYSLLPISADPARPPAVSRPPSAPPRVNSLAAPPPRVNPLTPPPQGNPLTSAPPPPRGNPQTTQTQPPNPLEAAPLVSDPSTHSSQRALAEQLLSRMQESSTSDESRSCIDKVSAQIPHMPQAHVLFCLDILTRAQAGTTEDLKGQVVLFMMHNDGVSGWCMPLKRVVEGMAVKP